MVTAGPILQALAGGGTTFSSVALLLSLLGIVVAPLAAGMFARILLPLG